MDRRGFLFAVLAAIGFGVAPVLAKKGLGGISPFLGGTVAVAAGLCLFSIVMLCYGKFRNLFQDPRRGILYLFSVGVSNTIAIAFLFAGLQIGMAIIVCPLTSTYPLITILLSFLFFREGERLNKRVLVGALLVIGGTILILCSQ